MVGAPAVVPAFFLLRNLGKDKAGVGEGMGPYCCCGISTTKGWLVGALPFRGVVVVPSYPVPTRTPLRIRRDTGGRLGA